jgi:hypothetical protein
MDIRAAITSWAGAGATKNARHLLDEWSRAQDEVTHLIARLDRRDRADDTRLSEPTAHRVG